MRYKRKLYCTIIFILAIMIPIKVEAKPKQTEVSKYALSWDGNKKIPYVWGGGRNAESLEELEKLGEGTDCSGFTSLVYKHFGIDIPAQSNSQREAAVKTFKDEKDAIPGDICWWSGHVAIYIGNGKIVHTNTRFPPTNYPHVSDFGNGEYRTPTLYLRMVKDIEDLKPLSGSDSDDLDDTVEGIAGYGNMITESDLTGMKIPEFLEEYRETVGNSDVSQLSSQERKSLAEIKENKDATETVENKSIKWFHVIQMFLGICCYLYAILLFLAYMFDYYNSFIDISLLGILTFGKFKIMESKEVKGFKQFRGYNESNRKTYITLGMIIFRCIVLCLIGALLTSGLVGDILLNAFDYFKEVMR